MNSDIVHSCTCMRWARVPDPAQPAWLPISKHHQHCPSYQLITFMVLELDGARCVMTTAGGEQVLHDEPDHDYRVSVIQMTQDQFDGLDEFDGF